MIYDYIIIGGGPSGSTTARCLQNKGFKCLILEKNLQIKEKPCGGLLTWTGINLLQSVGLDASILLAKGNAKLNGFIFLDGNKKYQHLYHCGEFGIGTRRSDLDEWLLNEANVSGVKIHYGVNVKNFCKKNDLFLVNDSKGKNLIFATGARGFFAFNDQSKLSKQTFGITEKIQGESILDDDIVYFWFINHLKEYFWIIPIGESIWNIGIWFKKLPSNPVEQFLHYKEIYLNSNFKWFKSVFPIKGAFCGNINLSEGFTNGCYGIGDFGGYNNSMTGEGIRYAIESAIKFADSQR